MVKMHTTPAYKTVAKVRRLGLNEESKKAASRKKPPLELLEDVYTKRHGSLDDIETLVTVLLMPDWIPPPTDILPRKAAAKEWGTNLEERRHSSDHPDPRFPPDERVCGDAALNTSTRKPRGKRASRCGGEKGHRTEDIKA
ncbi:MAG: hypothetical protein Q9196_001176 [Gyalolechia fulgens]